MMIDKSAKIEHWYILCKQGDESMYVNPYE